MLEDGHGWRGMTNTDRNNAITSRIADQVAEANDRG